MKLILGGFHLGAFALLLQKIKDLFSWFGESGSDDAAVHLSTDQRIYATRLAWRIQKFEKKYGSLSKKQKRYLARKLHAEMKKLGGDDK